MGKNPQTKSVLRREFSSGGLVFDFDKDLWLLIRPKNTDRWQLPKGKIEPGESSSDAAVREVKEESGINAEIMRKIGNNRYFFVFKGEKVFKTVTFYLMKYLSGNIEDHDEEVEEVVFVPFEKALEMLSFKDDKLTLAKAREISKEGQQGNLL